MENFIEEINLCFDNEKSKNFAIFFNWKNTNCCHGPRNF